MGKHSATVTANESLNNEVAAELMAAALRDFARRERGCARELESAGEYTASVIRHEAADACSRMAGEWDAARVSMWEARRAFVVTEGAVSV